MSNETNISKSVYYNDMNRDSNQTKGILALKEETIKEFITKEREVIEEVKKAPQNWSRKEGVVWYNGATEYGEYLLKELEELLK